MVHQLNGHSLGADLAPGPAKTSGYCPLKCSPVETPVPLSHLQDTHRPVLPCSPALSGLCPWCGRLIRGAGGRVEGRCRPPSSGCPPPGYLEMATCKATESP